MPKNETVTLNRADLEALLVHAGIALSLIQRHDDVLTGSESQMTRAILPGVIKKVREQTTA